MVFWKCPVQVPFDLLSRLLFGLEAFQRLKVVFALFVLGYDCETDYFYLEFSRLLSHGLFPNLLYHFSIIGKPHDTFLASEFKLGIFFTFTLYLFFNSC